jgi:hypothetical protein
MAFIMPACKRSSRVIIVLAGLLLATLSARADFTVTEVSARIVGQSLSLSGKLDLGLTAKVQEALLSALGSASA